MRSAWRRQRPPEPRSPASGRGGRLRQQAARGHPGRVRQRGARDRQRRRRQPPGRHRKPSQTGQTGQPAPAASGYLNPLRAVSGLVPERVDQGVDFAGTGPVYAIGDAVVTDAMGVNSGWPGGGWVGYQLTDGPDAGLVVYVAEDVTPTVQVGQHVSSATVIANMYNGGDGIETGWAAAQTSLTARVADAEAGGTGAGRPFPTMSGLALMGCSSRWACRRRLARALLVTGLSPPGYPAA